MSEFRTIQVSRDAFENELRRFLASEPEQAAFVSTDLDETASYYLALNGNAGVAVGRDGEIKHLFNHNAPSGTGKKLIEYAKRNGGTHLNCFDGKLAEIYRSHDFETTDRIEWDDEYAPDGWNYEKYGRPNVLIMELQA